MKKTVLAIETSCDDTSLALVCKDEQGNFLVDQLLMYSQIAHQAHGGVVPELASRLHSEQIIGLLSKIGPEQLKNINAIAVTTHPGLPGALVVGRAVATTLATWYNKPLLEVHHIHGHIFSLLLERKISDLQFPFVVLTASGGHNDIYLIDHTNANQHLTITKLWQTLDDAAGECFDKVARMLGGPYPGGARIGDQAKIWQSNQAHCADSFSFKRIFLSRDSFDFSFSWMKSQVAFLLEELKKQNRPLTDELVQEIAYEFQEAVVEVLVKKLVRAGLAYNAKILGIAWGVSCNERLRDYLQSYLAQKAPELTAIKPVKKVYSTDNAAMIGVVGLLELENLMW